MHCKRQQTPNKQGDDGWKSVHYEGTQLDVYRKQYMQQASAEEADVSQCLKKSRHACATASGRYVIHDCKFSAAANYHLL